VIQSLTLYPEDTDYLRAEHQGVSLNSVTLTEAPSRVVSVMAKESPRSTTMLTAERGGIDAVLLY
jgi:hypothetical protein